MNTNSRFIQSGFWKPATIIDSVTQWYGNGIRFFLYNEVRAGCDSSITNRENKGERSAEMFNRHKRWCFAFAIFGLLLVAQPTTGQEATPPTDNTAIDPRLAEAELRQKLAQAEAAIIKAEMEALKSISDASKGSGLGTLEAKDGAGYYSEILSYQTLKESVGKFDPKVFSCEAKEAKEAKEARAIVLSSAIADPEAELIYEYVSAALADFENKLEAALNDLDKGAPNRARSTLAGGAGSIAGATTLVYAAAQLASFARVDLTLSGKKIVGDQMGLLAATASALRAASITTIVPEIRLPDSKLVKDLSEVSKLQIKLKNASNGVTNDRDGKQNDLADLHKIDTPTAQDKEDINALTAEILALNQLIGEADQLLAAFTEFKKALWQRPEGTPSLMVRAVTAESRRGNCQLIVKTLSQGGDVEVIESVWNTGRVSFLGGNVAAYFFFDENGALVTAGQVEAFDAATYKGSKGAKSLLSN